MTIRPSHAHLAAALFLLMVTAPATATFGPGWASEVNALLTWKSSLVNTAGLSSWTQGFPVCNWTSVICGRGNRVYMIGIQGRGISGGLGTLDTAALPALSILDLSGNKLGGAIPASISQLRSLKFLDLSNNMFDGSIPPQLGDMQNIVTLRLDSNNLVGDIPQKLCGLLSVRLMDLSDNRLSGELPECWWNLQALAFMDLSNNSFSGEIPTTQASHNCSLVSLYLSENSFSGAFPPILEGCNSLTTLDIGNNMFFGGIPPWIGSHIPSLKILSIRSNSFAGEIPPELSQLSQLQLLDMANNSFTGSIPLAFGNLPAMRNQQNLSTLGPQGPEIKTKYDDRIDVTWKGQELVFERTIWLLTGIDLSGNLLSRCIPEELTNLQGLRFLNLSRNHLSCVIPEDIGRLNFLESLDLSSNEISGAIPPSISILSGLSMLNVSNNHLSGKIPDGNQMQTLTDPSIYFGNSGLCGFPLDILCVHTSRAPDKRDGGRDDMWFYYCVIAGIVFGFWLWFAMLFTINTWRCGFLLFVDDMQCKILQKMSN